MNLRSGPLFVLPLVGLSGCTFPPDLLTCEDVMMCSTTGTSSTGDAWVTTSDGPETDPGDGSATSGSTSSWPDDTNSGETADATGEPDDGPPTVLDPVVEPNYTNMNALLIATATAMHADGVRMISHTGELVELEELSPGKFGGTIPAFTGIDNGQHDATFTPWRDEVEGASKKADYVIALPPPGYELAWQSGADIIGSVVAIAVLPDGRPVELGTSHVMGESRCYLRLRDKLGKPVALVPSLLSGDCSATDLTIDRDTGVMHVLVQRTTGQNTLWWAGEISEWGAIPEEIGSGEVGDVALALASQPGLVAVCGAKPVATIDKFDAMAVLLRPDQAAQRQLFDYAPSEAHRFGDTVRDCQFADDTLVLVGEANGEHDGENNLRDRLMVIEYDVAANIPVWTLAGPGPGTQSRALAVDVDDKGRYHLAGYTCVDACVPEGEVRIYESGGTLIEQIQLGPLGSDWFGPHDIAWSPAGYAVVALGAQQGPSSIFKVEAFDADHPTALWSFTPKDTQGPQMALAVAVGPYGEVYAGGVAGTNHPVFVVIGG